MSASENAMSLSMLAGAAFVEGDFGKCLVVSADNTVSLGAAATESIVGLLGSAPAAIGDVVPVVQLQGRVKMLAAGTIAAGNLLICGAAGSVTGVANIGALVADQMAVGVALEAAVAGQIFEAVGLPLSSATIV